MRRIMKWLVLGLAAVVLVLGVGFARAHWAVRQERAPLPGADALWAMPSSDGPVSLAMINTASQTMPRGAVLEPNVDPRPDDPYIMSHPSFVLQWADGRMLLVDAGMNRDQALSFGRPLEWAAGAEAIQPHQSVAEQLGAQAQNVKGVVFTHLHTDHVGGITDLCQRVGHPLRVPMTPAQAFRPNYTTQPGLDLIAASQCAQVEPLSPASPAALAAFPGVVVLAAGGHTPGSQIIVAFVRGAHGVTPYVFAGDIANNIDGISNDIPKPFLYSLLMVPEDGERLGELRRYLRGLRDSQGAVVLVSHDQQHLEGSGVPAWTGAARLVERSS